MAAERQLGNYPPGLEDVARRFDITVVELLEEIASGELVVSRPSDDLEDYEDSDEDIRESIRRGLPQRVRLENTDAPQMAFRGCRNPLNIGVRHG